MKLQNSNLKSFGGAILVFTGAICFSSKAIMVKLAYEYNIDPVSLLNMRMFFSMPAFLIIALRESKKTESAELSKRDWTEIIFLGVIGYYLSSYLDFTGLKYITASLERLILFVYPTLVILISALIFRRPITKSEVFALFLTYTGIAIVFLNDVDMSGDIFTGGLLIFGSAFTYAIYLVGSGRLIPKLGSMRFNAYSMLISTAAVLLHYLISGSSNLAGYPAEVYFIGAAMALVATVIPSFLLAEGIKMIGAGTTSIVGSIGPVSTILLAYVFLGEKVSMIQLAGTALVLGGVLLVSRKK